MKAPVVNKATFDNAVRAAVEAKGGRRISFREFLEVSGLQKRDLLYNYAKWEEALHGAGFTFQPYNSPLLPHELLAEWGTVVRKLRRMPTQPEYRIHGTRDPGTIGRKLGSWQNMADAFRSFAGEREEWADVVAFINACSQKKRIVRWIGPKRPYTRKNPVRRVRRMRGRPEFGDPLDFPSLRHAPSNELGVVYLFGIVARSLGFAVEHMQNAFPDCLAKRRNPSTRKWQNVAIEFEYESRNFREHKHDPAGCDIIVCWEHNWHDCPENIEVIALSEEIKRLDSRN